MPANAPSERTGDGLSASSALLDRGDIVNLLGRLRDRLQAQGDKITVVQNRLIMQRIEDQGLIGEAAVRPEEQLGKIAGIAAEIVPMGRGRLEEELRACMG